MFVAAWALGTSVLVSSTLLALLGGLLFGPIGVVLSLVGSPLGALAALAMSRFLGGEALVGGCRAASPTSPAPSNGPGSAGSPWSA